MEKPTILISPLRAGVCVEGGRIDLLVRIQSPDRPENLPIADQFAKDLSLVIDSSGSMDGVPLKETFKCVEYIARHMQEQDRLSIISYNTEVEVLLSKQSPSVSKVKEAIQGVVARGWTNLHGGWLAGIEQLIPASKNRLSRVILLSDGDANRGITNRTELNNQAAAWAATGITTTTIGLGLDFDEELMVGMAQAGDGKSYYGETASDIFDGFSEELSLLEAIYLPKIHVRFITPPGVKLTMISPVKPQHDGRYTANNLVWGGENWFAVRLKYDPVMFGQGVHDLLAVTVEGILANEEAFQVHSFCQLPVLPYADLRQLPQDELVWQRLQELKFSAALEELRDAIKAGYIDKAERMLTNWDTQFSRHPWLKAKTKELFDLFNQNVEHVLKEAQFTSTRMGNRIASRYESLFSGDEMFCLEIPMYLRRKVSEGRGTSLSDADI